MKLKLAAIALIASMTLSCNTSFGCELLDRMLGRAGCSSCEAPQAPSCGCGGGLMDKIVSKSAGCGCCGGDMMTYDANMNCGPVASDCGCEAAAAPSCGCEAPVAEPCGCEAAPAPACGCETAAPSCGGGLNLFSKFGKRSCGCGSPAPAIAPVADCGCAAPAPVDCGCSAPAPAPVTDCGCEAPAAPACGGGGCGLFSKLRGGKSGCGCEAPAPVADCGCEAPAPVADCGCEAPVADCGCEAPAPVADCGCGVAKKPCSLGLFSKFKKAGCGGAAPVADCGCEAPAPVADCGCGSPAPVADCGCEAPAVSDCGCETPVADCGCGASAVSTCGCNGAVRGKLSLLDRLRGNRIPRTREGVVIGSQCNDGCNPPCPNQPTDCGCGAPAYQAAPCTSCGGGEVIYSDAQPTGGCSACGTSEGQIIYGEPVAVPATSMGSEEATNVAPVEPAVDANATEGVIESGDGASEASPVVDPGAFIPRRRTTVGS